MAKNTDKFLVLYIEQESAYLADIAGEKLVKSIEYAKDFSHLGILLPIYIWAMSKKLNSKIRKINAINITLDIKVKIKQ